MSADETGERPPPRWPRPVTRCVFGPLFHGAMWLSKAWRGVAVRISCVWFAVEAALTRWFHRRR